MHHDVSRQSEELVRLARARGLTYPIETKAQFVAQMIGRGDPVVFRGIAYDPEFTANLIPEFFFPVTSERDLVSKTLELLMARGLLPLRPLTPTGDVRRPEVAE